MSRRFAPLVLLLAALVVAMMLPAAAQAASAGPVRATDIDAYLASKGSPMTGQGMAFVASGGRWQVDPRLVVAIAGAESSFGQITCAPFNGWGWGCPNGPYTFESWADGIDAVTEGLRRGYLAEGRTTVALIHAKYAPVGAANDPTGLNNHWTSNVSRFLVEMGGDPNDLDMDGVAGMLPLGPLGAPALDSFGFLEDGADASPGSAPLTVSTDALTTLVISVRNTGYAAWRPRDVRLARVDSDPRIVGAPVAALSGDGAVQPDEVATFEVQLAAAGTTPGLVTTRWRVEGPSGPFGSELTRPVVVGVGTFVATDPAVEQHVDAGVTSVFVRVRNGGRRTWERDGEAAVMLGLVATAGARINTVGWANETTAAAMLERSVAPGEEATFAFRVRDGGSAGVLGLRPWSAGSWAAGDAIIVQLGAVAPAVVERVRLRTAAPG